MFQSRLRSSVREAKANVREGIDDALLAHVFPAPPSPHDCSVEVGHHCRNADLFSAPTPLKRTLRTFRSDILTVSHPLLPRNKLIPVPAAKVQYFYITVRMQIHTTHEIIFVFGDKRMYFFSCYSLCSWSINKHVNGSAQCPNQPLRVPGGELNCAAGEMNN
jgi:hypothetical protein